MQVSWRLKDASLDAAGGSKVHGRWKRVKLDGSSLDVAVMNSATSKDPKILNKEKVNEMEQANMGHRHISWKHVWSNFCVFRVITRSCLTTMLFFRMSESGTSLSMNTDLICSICDEEGSGKTLEEEEASSILFTPQDLLDSSGRLSTKHSYVAQHLIDVGMFINEQVCFLIGGARGSDHGVDDVVVGSGAYDRGGRRKRELRGALLAGSIIRFYSVVEGGGGEATSEVAPRKEVVSFGKKALTD
ncbi:Uncharacterized protein Rs2_27711 [Raphanus sativus]|nr:Uncharacterized protein Rs2_27711 [Raphanus sativus]